MTKLQENKQLFLSFELHKIFHRVLNVQKSFINNQQLLLNHN